MPDEFSASPKPWKWIETHHWEVQFHGLPPRVPWFEEDELPPLELGAGGLGPGFPVIRLYHAVAAYLADESVPEKDARFSGFAAQIDLGNEFVRSIERVDMIAAMGVMREMERTEHECGYLEFNKAFLLGRTGDAEGERAAYRRGTELAPDVEMLWAHYARTSRQAGDRAEAVRAYLECLRIMPRHRQAVEALVDMGELIVLPQREPGEDTRWLRPAEMRAQLASELAGMHGNAGRLRAFAGEILKGGLFPDLALEAAEEAVRLEPGDVEGLLKCGVALRVSGRPADSVEMLTRALPMDPRNVWVAYHLAAALIDLGDFELVPGMLDAALGIDPNHQPTLTLCFLNRAGRTDEQKEDDLADFGAARQSWGAFLIAGNHAWKRGARERAVRLAEQASKIAPEESAVFHMYTGMLAAVGEYEWVAALTRPRLGAGEKSPSAWLNYALALDAMGLREEAIRTLTRALAELTFAQPGERQDFENRLAHWSGCVADAGIEAETHPGTDVLLRSIFFVKNGARNGMVFEAGMGTPNKRVIEIRLEKPRDEFDLLLEQQNAEEPFEPLNLGAFTVRGYDSSRLAEEPLKVVFLYLPGGKIECAPWQGERRVRVSWNLVPPPRHESAEA